MIHYLIPFSQFFVFINGFRIEFRKFVGRIIFKNCMDPNQHSLGIIIGKKHNLAEKDNVKEKVSIIHLRILNFFSLQY